EGIRGIGRSLPQTSAALVVGGLAIVGLPPFSLFVSEFAILSEAFGGAHYFVAVIFLVMLSVVFGGVAHHLLGMLCGEPERRPESSRLTPSEYTAMGIAAVCLLWFGARVPSTFGDLLRDAMAVLR